MARAVRRALYLGLAVVLVVLGANAALATVPAMLGRSEDSRNALVNMHAYYRFGVDPTTLVVDVWDISAEASMADVDRSLLDVAKALHRSPAFSRVELAYRGASRFVMDGDYFRKLGEERDWQNPAYTMRTMAENMDPLDGRADFGVWTGGLLGVLAEQLNDHNELHRRWHLDAWAR